MPVPKHGQITVSASAQQLDPTTSANGCAGFTIYAPLTNGTAGVFIGSASVTVGNGYQLDPGNDVTYERIAQNGQPFYELNPSDFYVIGTAGDKISWLASK